jgi:hypothetical protein
MTAKLDQDLIDHACNQLAKAARRHVSTGMGPASAARAAIRETKALFPTDWNLAVQGDDDEEQVEVWEVAHKRSVPCASISREPESILKLTKAQQRNLEILREHGRVYRYKFQFYPMIGDKRVINLPVRELHSKTVSRLAQLGLLRESSGIDEHGNGYRIYEVV